MAYENQCGSCSNFEEIRGQNTLYDKSRPNYEKGYCTWYKVCYYPDDHCGHYSSRDGGGSSNCYLTTVICKRLGHSDQCEEMEVLRSFRNDVLQKNSQYAPILYEYDTVGPKIAKCLEVEDLDLIEKLYQSFIKPIVNLIKENQKEESIHQYMKMTNTLKEYYSISVDDNMSCDYDYTQGGHGIKKLKKEYR